MDSTGTNGSLFQHGNEVWGSVKCGGISGLANYLFSHQERLVSIDFVRLLTVVVRRGTFSIDGL